MDSYPLISELLLTNALEYASSFTTITDQDKEIIMHTRKSLLFDEEKPWAKRSSSALFDVTMGSYDGVEVCDLVGLYILSKLSNKYRPANISLYRDDGLAALRNTSPRNTDKKSEKDFLTLSKSLAEKSPHRQT